MQWIRSLCRRCNGCVVYVVDASRCNGYVVYVVDASRCNGCVVYVVDASRCNGYVVYVVDASRCNGYMYVVYVDEHRKLKSDCTNAHADLDPRSPQIAQEPFSCFAYHSVLVKQNGLM